MSISPVSMPPVIILCGGKGTRLRDATELLPKPMVPIGPQPIIWHIMKTYAAFGVNRFILCLGYKREAFIDYFFNYQARACDVTLKLGKHSNVIYHNSHEEEEWEVTLADTGLEVMTGCRIARAAKYLGKNDDNFFITYGDAVADIDIKSLYQHHLSHEKDFTITAVHPAGRFGEMNIGQDAKVQSFEEKPPLQSGYINGGFMVAKKNFAADYLYDDVDLVLEQEPMRRLIEKQQMTAYKHEGFWQCMDNAREHKLLNDTWDAGMAPWTKGWKG